MGNFPFSYVTAGNLIAQVNYAPGANQTYNQGTAYAVLDAANLAIAVPVPASGRVCVDVGIDWGLFGLAGYAATTDMFLGLALHGTGGGTILGVPHSVGGLSVGAALAGTFGIGAHDTHRFLVTGLTPGATVTMDVVGAVSSVTNILAQYYAGPTGVVTTDPVAPTLIQAFAA